MSQLNRFALLLSLAGFLVAFAIPTAAFAADKVLVLSTTVSGGHDSVEALKAQSLGFEVEIATPTEWEAKSAAEFSTYRAIVLGDPTCGDHSVVEAAEATTNTWGPRVNGNVMLVGSDPVYHDGQGGRALTDTAVAYATDQPRKTGAYISLSCYEHGVAEQTAVPLLDGLSSVGDFTVRGVGCYNDAHITATDSAIGGLTDGELSGWGCSVHEAFDSYPEDFVVLAIARDIGETYTAPDGSVGTPYILARGEGTSYLGRSYVALGDSVSAGEGIAYDYRWSGTDNRWHRFGPESPSWNTDFTVSGCHQTAQAYPRVAADELSAKLLHLSCTGSTARNGVLGDRTGSVNAPAQLGSSIGGFASPNSRYDEAKPDIVSLSLGANDVDFAERVERCYGLDIGGCDTNPSQLNGPLADAKHDLGLVLDEINRRAPAGKRPLTILTQYIDPFPRQWDDDCPDLDIPVPGLGLSKKEMDFLRDGLQRLNRNIADVAEERGAFTLPASSSSLDHPFCSSDPWTFGPSILTNNLFGPDRHSTAPFHPTPDGQQAIGEAMATLVRQKLQVRTGSGVKVKLPGGVLLYDNVTGAGEAVILQGSQWSPQPAASSFMKTAGFDVFSSATYTGNISISLPSNGAQSLFHYVNGGWVLVPSSYGDGYVTGVVSSLSPFALGEPVSPLTAHAGSEGGGAAPATVAFSGLASSVEDGSPISSYEWDFGDGSSSDNPTPTHVYAQSGEYVASLTVTAANGAVDEATTKTVVTNAAPTARITGPSGGVVGESLDFDSAGSTDPNGTVMTHAWDFGDGVTTGIARTSHVFDAPGVYTVKLQITDSEGEPAEDSLNVVIGTGQVRQAQSAGTPPTAKIDAGSPRLRFGKKVLRLDERGRILVPISCAAERADCAARLSLSIRRRGAFQRLASKSVRVESGRSTVVRMTPREGALRGVGQAAIAVYAKVVFAGGGAPSLSRKLTLTLRP